MPSGKAARGPFSSLLGVLEPAADRAQIIHRIVAMTRERLGLEVSFVSEFAGGQRMFRFIDGETAAFDIDVDEGDPLDDTYCQRIVDGVLPSLLPDTRTQELTRTLQVTDAMGLGAYVGVPVVLSDGRLYGTFCVASREAQPHLSARDVDFLRVAASLVAEQLEQHIEQEVPRRLAREQTLAAIAGEGVSTVYQPVFEIETGRIRGVEALSRFTEEPVRPPDVWFAQAWEVGLGPELELATASRALEDLGQLPDEISLALNFSPDTLLTDEALGLLSSTVGGRVIVEVTEHAPIHDYAPFRARLDELRERGVRVGLDDMGTGYAGLTALVELRPDVHKIDLSIVRGIRHDRSRRGLVAAWVSYAAVVGAEVIAEGVESDEELTTLEILGLRHAQGFHLARPAPLDELTARFGGVTRSP